MRDSAEAKRCSDCNTEFYSSYYSKPDACKECAVTHDDYTPEVDGEPCADCSKPVWYCHDEEQWFHLDAAHGCFLASGKDKPRCRATA
jgi:hypothetical protein|tara:strand:+ start:202 stop:465 length:264 start_codon:yes stop_codon:yes gene_type:complete